MTDTSRRTFVGTSIGAAAWAAFARESKAGTSNAASDRMSRLTLGIASYSFREFTLDQALDMAKTLGVTHMTFKDVHVPRTDPPETTRALRARIEAAGITLMGSSSMKSTCTVPSFRARCTARACDAVIAMSHIA